MTQPNTVRKVLAYITRSTDSRRQLLVFTHRDYPDAGIQVPAGTIKDGESIEAALYREIFEETGLSSLQLVRKLGVFYYHKSNNAELHERHIFHLTADEGVAYSWEWVETGGGEVEVNEGYVFRLFWTDMLPPPDLAGKQGDYLSLL